MSRPLAGRFATVGRDLGALLGPLVGRSLEVPPRLFAHARSGPRRLVVAEVARETADAVTLTFAPSPDLPTWRAGEFLTLGFTIEGAVHRRAYSIAVPPPAPGDEPRAAVTVKRVAGGRVSGWLVDHAAPGLTVEVQGPSGRFVCAPEPARARHLVLVAGGSGVTPLRAIAEQALRDEPLTRVTLVYGNRGPADVIFARRLDELAARYESRLTILRALSEPPEGWTGHVGVLDRAALARLMPAHARDTSYWLCGPEPMMAAARDELAARGVPAVDVMSERFLALGAARPEVALPTTPQALVVRHAGRVWRTTVAPGSTVLEAALQAGAPMPHSCTLGGCGRCRVRLRAGEVAYATPNCLTDDELRDGDALACVAQPMGPLDVEVP
ncbi:MAG: ferredoxin--NADP reductase [Deltaproteobacteria bacterium]|nr:ferredoxin--NADP reductase [Deltaproteobacteria bacterium]